MKTRAPDNRLVGLESSAPHGAIDTGLPRVLDTTATTVAPEPEWTHAPRDGVDGTRENYFAIDAQGNIQWATEGEVDAAKLEHAKRGAAYNRRLRDLAIDGRALLDGRVPDGYVAGDPLPDNCYAMHPHSRYLQNYYSTLLCTCEKLLSLLEKSA